MQIEREQDDRFTITSITSFGHQVSIIFDHQSSVVELEDFMDQVIVPLLYAQGFSHRAVQEYLRR